MVKMHYYIHKYKYIQIQVICNISILVCTVLPFAAFKRLMFLPLHGQIYLACFFGIKMIK